MRSTPCGELIPSPSDWKFRLNLDAATLTSQLGKHRLLCLKAFLAGQKRIYSAVSVKDGQGNAWNGKITKADLKTTLGEEVSPDGPRLLRGEEEDVLRRGVGGQPDRDPVELGYRLTASQVNARLKKDDES